MGAAIAAYAQMQPRAQNVERAPAVGNSRYTRLRPHQFVQLVDEFHQYRVAQNGGSPRQETSEKMLEVALYFLSGGGYLWSFGRHMGVAPSTAHLHVNEVVEFFLHIAPHHIKLPQPHELPLMSMGRVGNKHIVLLIDGTLIHIMRPDNAGAGYFCGRSGYHFDSINVQLVTDKWGTIRHIVTGLPGTTHDKTAIEWSVEFTRFLDTLPPDCAVLGDAAYTGHHRNLVTVLRGNNLTPAEEYFNEQARAIRQQVENHIGAVKTKWRSLIKSNNREPFFANCGHVGIQVKNRVENLMKKYRETMKPSYSGDGDFPDGYTDPSCLEGSNVLFEAMQQLHLRMYPKGSYIRPDFILTESGMRQPRNMQPDTMSSLSSSATSTTYSGPSMSSPTTVMQSNITPSYPLIRTPSTTSGPPLTFTHGSNPAFVPVISSVCSSPTIPCTYMSSSNPSCSPFQHSAQSFTSPVSATRSSTRSANLSSSQTGFSCSAVARNPSVFPVSISVGTTVSAAVSATVSRVDPSPLSTSASTSWAASETSNQGKRRRLDHVDRTEEVIKTQSMLLQGILDKLTHISDTLDTLKDHVIENSQS